MRANRAPQFTPATPIPPRTRTNVSRHDQPPPKRARNPEFRFLAAAGTLEREARCHAQRSRARMADTRGLKPSQMWALLYLWRLAVHEGGYKLCGVRGWAHLEDVEEATRQALWDQLPPLHRRGLLDHMDARAPGRSRPVWVYRISDRGVRAVHDFASTVHGPIPTLNPAGSEAPVWAPQRQRGALQLLRAAYDDPATPIRFGERGWLTGRELGERVHERNRARGRAPFLAVDATDLRWLLGKRLIERRDEPPPPGRQAAVIFWRVTELGRYVPLLDWKPIPGEQ